MATIKEMLTVNTADILEATELLKVLGDREGQFVWKKMAGVKQITLTQTTDNANPTILQVASEKNDLSQIDASWFIGMSGTYAVNNTTYPWEIISETQMIVNTTTTTFSYNSATAQISVGMSLSKSGRVWSGCEGYDSLEYVVADDENAYPSGGSEIITITQKNTGTNPTILQCASNDIDLSTLTVEDFYGYSGTATASGKTLTFVLDEKGFTYNTGTCLTVQYDSANAQLKLGDSFSTSYTFPSYVVSKDDGMLDGYWYKLFDPTVLISENIREGVDVWGIIGAMSEGVSGFECGEFTLSSASGTVTIEHELGTAPSYVAIMHSKANSISSSGYIACVNGVDIYYNSGLKIQKVSTLTKTATSVKVSAGHNFFANAKYYWVAIV